MRLLRLLLITLWFIFLAGNANAKENVNSFITIVNPVRISSYTENPAKSLMAEYGEIRKRDMSATWLLTFDAVMDSSVGEIVSAMNEKQELGIFLEVTENFSKNSGVLYNKTDGWQRATSVFLTGYSQDDRRKLIDRVFSEFKKNFGYYPKSVGAWWVDSYSLSYMKDRYKITGVLGISDQYDLDGYSVWGTPWSTPFYPSALHAGIPSNDISRKIDIVTFRWAARDPLNGYASPNDRQASLYSSQDYHVAGQSAAYLDNLIELYSVRKDYNDFAHLTIGSEADYSPETYVGAYARHLDLVSEYQQKGVRIATMKDFSEWYRKTFPRLSPLHVIESKDLLGTDSRSFWIQGNSYRIGFVYNSSSRKTRIVDLRIYQNNFMEPFYKSPNKQLGLSINLPYVVDFVIDKESTVELNLGNFLSLSRESDRLSIFFEKGTIFLDEEEIVLPVSTISLESLNSEMIEVQKNKDKILIKPVKNYKVPPEGTTIHSFYPNIPFVFKVRLDKYIPLVAISLLSFGVILIKNKKIVRKHRKPLAVIVGAFILLYLFLRATTSYYVSQTEMDGLSVLSRLPQGNVLTYDKDCLRCKFSTPNKPAAAAGIKSYVGQKSGQRTVSDYSFVTAKNSQKSREILKEKSIDYVYLSKYEGYIESLLYLQQDLGLYKIYENANSEIWGTQ